MLLAQLHVSYRCGGGDESKPRFLRYVCAMAVLVNAMLAIAYTSIFGSLLTHALGIQFLALFMDPQTNACMFTPGGNGCEMLHLEPGVYHKFADASAPLQTERDLLASLWGATSSAWDAVSDAEVY